MTVTKASESRTRPAARRRGRPLTPERELELAQHGSFDWRAWWQQFGRQHREIREFVGFSQEQVARLAGVSQGAVSRLEAGKGLGTPLLVILKINLVIRRALATMDTSMLKPDLRQFLELERRLSPPVGTTGFNALPVTEQPELQELVRLFRRVPERNRYAFVTVVRAVARALSHEKP
jgi:transcriptional regulator with XRE-family HTH domain